MSGMSNIMDRYMDTTVTSTAGVTNGQTKQRRSLAIAMRFYWIKARVKIPAMAPLEPII
jgi:hypothetical protein